jgi:hypothetical protein
VNKAPHSSNKEDNMKVIEAINHIDAVKPNAYGMEAKLRWLSVLDGIIKKEIIDTHEDGTHIKHSEYTSNSLMTDLIVAPPYDDIYIKWLEAQIDYANGEYGKYNNSITMYNNAYQAYAKAYNREHLPKNTSKIKNW